MSHTPFLSRAFDEVAKPFLKEFSKSGDDVIGESLKLDVTSVILYANASSCESGATLKLTLQTSPDGVKWYGSSLEIAINTIMLSGRTVVQMALRKALNCLVVICVCYPPYATAT